MGSETLLGHLADRQQIEVERAIAEFRAARPVRITASSRALLAFPVEGLSEKIAHALDSAGHAARLVVPGATVKAFKPCDEDSASILISPFTAGAIAEIVGRGVAGAKQKRAEFKVTIAASSLADEGALALSKLAMLLPAAIVVEPEALPAGDTPLLSVEAEAILAFRDREAKSLKIVTRAFVPLEGVERSEFVVFRGGDGFRDQIAVVVSAPPTDRPVLARIHSACLTGDLFGSLKCDCGDQLRGTVRAMAEQGGGIVLYLDQEGRGNGIANKIRAYGLQAEGFDTYDADELLGFSQDGRRFDFAAEMLKQLGYHSVRLMTNNPLKIEALRKAGLDVVSTHRVLTRPTVHNSQYLAAKRDKAGHLIGDIALDGLEVEEIMDTGVTQPS